jgi:hypothetical protein
MIPTIAIFGMGMIQAGVNSLTSTHTIPTMAPLLITEPPSTRPTSSHLDLLTHRSTTMGLRHLLVRVSLQANSPHPSQGTILQRDSGVPPMGAVMKR